MHFFDKHFVLANMLNGAAASVGYLIFPVLMEFLINHYGLKGAFLISSAVMANICVCGLLLPMPQIQKAKNTPCLKCTEATTKGQTLKNACVLFLKEVALAFDLSLFRNVQFLFQAIANGVLFGGCFAAPMYLVPVAISVGVSPTQSSFLMMAYGSSMVLVRLSPLGVLVDRNIVSASTLSGAIYLIYGVVIIASPLMRTYRHHMIVAALFGVLPGLGNPLQYVVVARTVGARNKGPAAMSWFTLGNGLGASIIILFVGEFQFNSIYNAFLTL